MLLPIPVIKMPPNNSTTGNSTIGNSSNSSTVNRNNGGENSIRTATTTTTTTRVDGDTSRVDGLRPAGPPHRPKELVIKSAAAATPATSTAKKLAEYRLIASYREQTRASVDEFHAFLIGLGTGTEADVGEPRHGRFWALVACLLSVQCRDHVALVATRALLRRCAGQGAAGVHALPEGELEQLVHSCNFCVTKAKNVRAAAAHAAARDGRVPASYDGLLALTGVGPKIAHLMRSVAFGEQDAGIVVDTHVFRVATKLGWADAAAALSGAERVRQQLEGWVPVSERIPFSLAVVGFGQLSRSGKGWGREFVEHVRRIARAEHAAGAGDDGGATTSELPNLSDDALAKAKAQEEVVVVEAVSLAESIVARLGGGAGEPVQPDAMPGPLDTRESGVHEEHASPSDCTDDVDDERRRLGDDAAAVLVE